MIALAAVSAQLVARLDDGDIAAIGIIGGLVMLLAALCV